MIKQLILEDNNVSLNNYVNINLYSINRSINRQKLVNNKLNINIVKRIKILWFYKLDSIIIRNLNNIQLVIIISINFLVLRRN